jgi:hypothetical protein
LFSVQRAINNVAECEGRDTISASGRVYNCIARSLIDIYDRRPASKNGDQRQRRDAALSASLLLLQMLHL